MINQQQTQKQQQKILPQQIQLLNILHLTTVELQQRISDEIDDNPFLEDKPSEEETSVVASSDASEIQEYNDWEEYAYDDRYDQRSEYVSTVDIPEGSYRPLVESENYKENIKQQLSFLKLSEEQAMIAEYIVDSLNESGMLEHDDEEMANDISFQKQVWIEPESIKEVIACVQKLDPQGLGCRSIREYWMLQLENMRSKHELVPLTIYILETYFKELTQRNFEKIAQQTGIDKDQMKNVVKLLHTLRMKPVDEQTAQQYKDSIIADFIITSYHDQFEVALASSRSSSLGISSSFAERCKDKSSSQYLKSKYNSAVWFIDAIKEREKNMLNVMNAIVHLQKDYFMDGDEAKLRPMILKNIADMVGVDISTVSRITSNKYADTPFGIISLKKLFNEGIANKEGDIISTKVIQSRIVELIENEDKHQPYTDQQLANMLAGMGYSIARRTVAKYRESLHLPMVQMRGRNGYINL